MAENIVLTYDKFFIPLIMYINTYLHYLFFLLNYSIKYYFLSWEYYYFILSIILCNIYLNLKYLKKTPVKLKTINANTIRANLLIKNTYLLFLAIFRSCVS